MSATITRRALFKNAGKVTAAGALAGLPAVASAQPSRAAWDAAVALLEAADAAQNAYYADVHKPAEAAWAVGRKEMPKFAMPAGYGPDQHDKAAKIWLGWKRQSGRLPARNMIQLLPRSSCSHTVSFA
jgi:hypothetical protein